MQGFSRHNPRRDFRELYPGRFGDKRHGPRGSRIGFDHKHLPLLDRKLNIQQTDYIQPVSKSFCVVNNYLLCFQGEIWGRNNAGAIARMHTSLLHVFENSTKDKFACLVSNRINIDFSCVL